MKANAAVTWMTRRARLTAVGWGLGTVFACLALSACTSGSATTTTVLSPSASGTTTVIVSPTETSTTVTPSPSPTDTTTVIVSPSPTVTSTVTVYPTEAPVTGGGGTAGFQDAGLAILGGLAVLGGVGTFVYRRLTRKR
jgi:hypothetical protein